MAITSVNLQITRMAKIIGLTGGIGCGKTEAAKILRRAGSEVLDADLLARTMVETNPEILKHLRVVFGSQFFSDDGKLRRQELGNYVFSDPLRTVQLNQLVHPYLLQEIKKTVSVWRNMDGIYFIDAALIFETGMEKLLDGVLVISSRMENRIARVGRRDGLSREAILSRIGAQMAMEEKVSRATWLIENDASIKELEKEILLWIRDLDKD